MPWAAVAVLAILAAGLGYVAWRATRPVEHSLVRLDVDLGSDVTLPPLISASPGVILSPDGKRLVYESAVSGKTKLLTRRLDQPKATELPGTDGASSPFFSPDGAWVGFLANGKISKIAVEGGAVVPLIDLSANFAGATWGEDGTIIASEALGRGLVRVPDGGGTPTVLAPLGDQELALAHPQILPGGKAVLMAVYHGALDPDKATIEVFTLADRKRKIVRPGGVSPRFVPASGHMGHLLYANKATLFAIPFDLDKLETRGTALKVLDDVGYTANTNSSHYAVTPTSDLVYRKASAAASGTLTLEWLDTSGKRQPLWAKPGNYTELRVSPEGKRIALRVGDGSNFDIWAYEPQREATTRLTFGGSIVRVPVWSPDGQFVVFSSRGVGIGWTRADGGTQPQTLITGATQIPWSFTADGKRLAYFQISGTPQIWTVPIEEDGGILKAGKPEQFLKDQSTDVNPALSPDGHWLAYESNASGGFEVHVRAFPDNGGHWQISNGIGSASTKVEWSGHDLIYQQGNQLMAAAYSLRDRFVAEKPRVWISALGGVTSQNWDLAPDGKRVAIAAPMQAGEAPKQEHVVVLLQNFGDDLRRRVPLEK